MSRSARSRPLGPPLALPFLLSLALALTGFVCTHKIQAEEECLSSHILCYECDSRSDSNCADPFLGAGQSEPFELPVPALPGPSQQTAARPTASSVVGNLSSLQTSANELTKSDSSSLQQSQLVQSLNATTTRRFPPVALCHGCCVKITSKTPEGVSYVKRTCLTNLQINYFMVGLVCMKESGARGKMCFCETDYCNGQPSHFRFGLAQIQANFLLALLVASWLLAIA